MGRFSPGVVDQYYPGAFEALSNTLGNLSQQYIQRGQQDRRDKVADTLEDLAMRQQGFVKGTQPQVATPTDGGPAFKSQAEMDANNKLLLTQGDRQTDAQIASNADASDGNPPAIDSSMAGAPGANTPQAPAKPLGAFDPASGSFQRATPQAAPVEQGRAWNMAPKAGTSDMGMLNPHVSRGSQPANYYYDPSASIEGQKMAYEAAMRQHGFDQQVTLHNDTETHEDARAEAARQAEAERARAAQAIQIALAGVRESGDDRRTKLRVDAANGRSQELHGAIISQRREEAVARTADKAMSSPSSPTYGDEAKSRAYAESLFPSDQPQGAAPQGGQGAAPQADAPVDPSSWHGAGAPAFRGSMRADGAGYGQTARSSPFGQAAPDPALTSRYQRALSAASKPGSKVTPAEVRAAAKAQGVILP